MNELSKSVEVHLGSQGRLVIPAALRRSRLFEFGVAIGSFGFDQRFSSRRQSRTRMAQSRFGFGYPCGALTILFVVMSWIGTYIRFCIWF
jgi:hypothetical protein